ncbi:MAG: hypothetical protein LBK52_03340, partial [Deltaproteobacteria bacterium]|nr:hypothetical protein [Deltaproteobacteria bacterium]
MSPLAAALALAEDPDSIGSQKEYIEYSKQVHRHSPAVQRLLDLSEDYIPGAERAYKNDHKPAVWSSGYNWDPPFLYSLGFTPAAYSEMGRYSTREDM